MNKFYVPVAEIFDAHNRYQNRSKTSA